MSALSIFLRLLWLDPLRDYFGVLVYFSKLLEHLNVLFFVHVGGHLLLVWDESIDHFNLHIRQVVHLLAQLLEHALVLDHGHL